MKRLEERTKEADAEAIKAEEKLKASGKKRRGGKRKRPLGTPKGTAQENFTDSDSRIMKTSAGFEQCYNAQTAVDSTFQFIVANKVTNLASDVDELLPVLDLASDNTGTAPCRLLADAGYKSEANFAELEERKIRAFIPLGRKDSGDTDDDPDRPASMRMRRKMRSKRGRDSYRPRKHIAEAPFACTRFSPKTR